jgi:hypothetical protein
MSLQTITVYDCHGKEHDFSEDEETTYVYEEITEANCSYKVSILKVEVPNLSRKIVATFYNPISIEISYDE